MQILRVFLSMTLLSLFSACQQKSKSCSKAEQNQGPSQSTSALYVVQNVKDQQCLAVQIAHDRLLSSASCMKELCDLGCEGTLSLKNDILQDTLALLKWEAYPNTLIVNDISVRGSDLALLRTVEPLKSKALVLADHKTTGIILEQHTSRVLDQEHQNLMIARHEERLGWLRINSRAPMGLMSQDYLVGSIKHQVCPNDRGGALIGRVNEEKPFLLLGITSRGFSHHDWIQDCSYSDGNVVSLTSLPEIKAWLEKDGPLPSPQDAEQAAKDDLQTQDNETEGQSSKAQEITERCTAPN